MTPNIPILVGPGFKGAMGEPQQHTWFIKDMDQKIIAEGVGLTPIDAQNDLVEKLEADGWTPDEINETFKTYIDKGFFVAIGT